MSQLPALSSRLVFAPWNSWWINSVLKQVLNWVSISQRKPWNAEEKSQPFAIINRGCYERSQSRGCERFRETAAFMEWWIFPQSTGQFVKMCVLLKCQNLGELHLEKGNLSGSVAFNGQKMLIASNGATWQRKEVKFYLRYTLPHPVPKSRTWEGFYRLILQRVCECFLLTITYYRISWFV